MFKRAKVVPLSTNQKASIFLCNGKLFQTPEDREFREKMETDINYWKKQHLYILSDDEIKEGDWFINRQYFIEKNGVKEYEVWQCDKNFINSDDCKKIIASTDSSLTGGCLNNIPLSDHTCVNKKQLPSPSQSFIDKYVSEYNKGNIITDVMVEYTRNSIYDIADGGKDYFLKVNSKDNTITIKKIKDSWDKEEVEQQLVYCVSELAALFGHANTAELMKKWNEATHKWAKNNL